MKVEARGAGTGGGTREKHFERATSPEAGRIAPKSPEKPGKIGNCREIGPGGREGLQIDTSSAAGRPPRYP